MIGREGVQEAQHALVHSDVDGAAAAVQHHELVPCAQERPGLLRARGPVTLNGILKRGEQYLPGPPRHPARCETLFLELSRIL